MHRLWLAVLLVACGGGPTSGPASLDVFHDVYFRGPPADPGHVALSFSGPDACTADVLARLRTAGGEAGALPATFFMSAAAIADYPDQDRLPALVRRLVDEGHEIAVGVDIEADWRADPAAFRKGLQAAEADLAEALRALKVPVRVQRFWRPAAKQAVDYAWLGSAAAVDRPLVLWSRHLPADTAPGMVEAAARTANGDILALESGADCAVVAALPGVVRQLESAKMKPATVSTVLAPHLDRHEPLRVVRYFGDGLPGACAEPLAVPLDAGAEQARWGLVDFADAAAVRVLPVSLPAPETGALLEQRAELHRLWGLRGQWRGMPGCLRDVPWDRVVAPITPNRAGQRINFWVADSELLARDARSLAAPSHPTVLPGLFDLVRLEARQRMPARYRGLVAGALRELGLEVPFLIEARATVGVVVGQALPPEALEQGVDTLRDAVAGYVQLVEVSIGEYLFLAEQDPRGRVALSQAARSADGFVRAGPFLILPVGRGGSPDPSRIALDGTPALEESPEAMLARVLRAGRGLGPGDVVAAPMPPLRGAPPAQQDPDAVSLRAALRTALTRSILRGLAVPAYLRPGGTMAVDGDLLGRQTLRIAVPAGVAVPTTSGRPLADSAEGEGDSP